MDAPPEKGEDVRPFLSVAAYLSGLGLSAPRVLAQDQEAGFLLIEDLGDDLFARVTARDPGAEMTLYAAATDVLATLHDASPMPGLARYDAVTMTPLAGLAYDWYLAESLDRNAASSGRNQLYRHHSARLSRRKPAVAAGP